MSDYSGVNHLAFATGDLERTIRYWRDLLGMRLLFTAGWEDYKIYFFGISPGALVGFFQWPGVEPVEEKEHGVPKKGPFVFDHVSIGVESEEGLYALKDRLTAAEEWVSEVTDHGFIRSIYTFDPNGIPLEFSVFVEGVDISREPVLADTDPPPAAASGPEPETGFWPNVEGPGAPGERRVYPGMGSELFRGRQA